MNTPIPIVARHAPPAPQAEPAELPVVDAEGDAIFRFRLRPPSAEPGLTLDEFYRAQLHDLLKVVRLYVGTAPVLVDGFAFRREPDRIQPLQPRAPGSDAA
jgi:hypothetical protein